jgi:mono/diheme cytochrome c family protein
MRFLLGLILGLIAAPVAAIVYLVSGYAPIAVTDHPFPLEQYIAGAALERGIDRRAPTQQLSSFNENDLTAGAQTYRRGCGCHGLPGEAQNLPQPKMFPSPPQLFTPDGYVTDDPVGVTFWKIKNGIRMTGMPSFSGVLKDDQMWQVAALLASADKLPPNVRDVLKQPLFPPTATANAPAKPAPDAKRGKATGHKP